MARGSLREAAESVREKRCVDAQRDGKRAEGMQGGRFVELDLGDRAVTQHRITGAHEFGAHDGILPEGLFGEFKATRNQLQNRNGNNQRGFVDRRVLFLQFHDVLKSHIIVQFFVTQEEMP